MRILVVDDEREMAALLSRGLGRRLDRDPLGPMADAAAEGDARAGRLIVDILGDEAGSAASESREDDPITKSLKEEAARGTE